ncbi:hypothetical protein [Pseudomonas sp. P9_31]|uniref:hypothetical protein n=1 Tax=Pseudomonas sp. P9_31 TaxID=3043448 RepID=UPI002A35E7E7|nr:hypothetical protein [Pseudomonas sp. P9_31]WPN56113.1 hypothetical protein QMK51_18375 [Pseudomonas sp. P9_31]
MNVPSAAEALIDLPPPSIKENPDNTNLNPVAVKDTLTAVVQYALQPTDRISVTWTGAAGTPAEGSYTTGFVEAGSTYPREIPLYTAMVAFNLGKTVTVTYTVIRENSEPVTSLPLTLNVLPLAQDALPRPFITQAPDYGAGSVLDVRDLTEFTLRMNGWPLIAYGQYVWLHLKGTNADGSLFNVTYWKAPTDNVSQPWIRYGFHQQNFSANPLKGLKDGSTLTLEFKAALGRSLNEDEAVRFALRTYTVRTLAAVQFPPPSIKENPDNTNLNPVAVKDSLTAVVQYALQPTDRISVTWTGAAGTPAEGSYTTDFVEAGSTHPREIPLRNAVVAFSLGKTVTVTYTVIRENSEPVTSLPLTLKVQTIPADKLIAPVITQANGTAVLDLKDVLEGATLLFGSWPLIAAGQRVWLDLEGRKANGDTHNLTMWVGGRNSVTRGWASSGSFSTYVAYSYLRELGDGSTLSIRFKLNMDKVANLATAVAFPVRTYTVLGL